MIDYKINNLVIDYKNIPRDFEKGTILGALGYAHVKNNIKKSWPPSYYLNKIYSKSICPKCTK